MSDKLVATYSNMILVAAYAAVTVFAALNSFVIVHANVAYYVQIVYVEYQIYSDDQMFDYYRNCLNYLAVVNKTNDF